MHQILRFEGLMHLSMCISTVPKFNYVYSRKFNVFLPIFTVLDVDISCQLDVLFYRKFNAFSLIFMILDITISSR